MFGKDMDKSLQLTFLGHPVDVTNRGNMLISLVSNLSSCSCFCGIELQIKAIKMSHFVVFK